VLLHDARGVQKKRTTAGKPMKNKTHKGMKKRVKITATGKLMRRRAFSSHILTKKPSKRKRKFRKDSPVHGTNAAKCRDLLGI
jgi:large subunit ribosomal protein L35